MGKRHTKLEREQVKKKQVVERTQQFSQQHLIERKQQCQQQQEVGRTKQCPQQQVVQSRDGHPAPPRIIDKIRRAQRVKTDCRFH